MSSLSGNVNFCPFFALGEGGRGVWRTRQSVLTKSPFSSGLRLIGGWGSAVQLGSLVNTGIWRKT